MSKFRIRRPVIGPSLSDHAVGIELAKQALGQRPRSFLGLRLGRAKKITDVRFVYGEGADRFAMAAFVKVDGKWEQAQGKLFDQLAVWQIEKRTADRAAAQFRDLYEPKAAPKPLVAKPPVAAQPPIVRPRAASLQHLRAAAFRAPQPQPVQAVAAPSEAARPRLPSFLSDVDGEASANEARTRSSSPASGTSLSRQDALRRAGRGEYSPREVAAKAYAFAARQADLTAAKGALLAWSGPVGTSVARRSSGSSLSASVYSNSSYSASLLSSALDATPPTTPAASDDGDSWRENRGKFPRQEHAIV